MPVGSQAEPPGAGALNLEVYREAIVRYRKWLEREERSACKRFIHQLDSGDDAAREGVLGEAIAWNWLEPRSTNIQYHECPSHGGPDFKCDSAHGPWYVEVTTIRAATMTNATGLQHHPTVGACYYGPATEAIKKKIIDKASQVAALDAPVVIFVVTFHFQASALVFSTGHLEDLFVGSQGVRSKINLQSGESGPLEPHATLDHPLFFQSKTLTPLRQHISAVLLGGFGVHPPDCVIRGVLHPAPRRLFDARNLPDTCFGAIEPWPVEDSSRIVWRKADGTDCSEAADRERRLHQARRHLRDSGYGHLLDPG